MAHVVCEPCALCEKERRSAPCVLACPVDAFFTTRLKNSAGKPVTMNVINPLACTDCKACVPACPSRAIFHEDIAPDEWQRFVLLNYLQSTDPQAEHCVRPRPQPPCDPPGT
jgi:Fe-S-cluster-containing hydrogenase component 2